MKEVDFERALMLMSVQEKCAATGVMMTSIAGEAGEELKEINESCRQNALERADETRRKEMDRVVAEQAKLRNAAEGEGHDNVVDNLGAVPNAQPYMPGQPVPPHDAAASPTDHDGDGLDDSMDDTDDSYKPEEPNDGADPRLERRT